MSALAHRIESQGIATTVISLIRLHSERVRPPRTLWVPFQLGRPLGSPGNPELQRRVLEAALALLERVDGPVLLQDFPDEEPLAEGDEKWARPSLLDAEGSQLPIADELERLRPLYERAVASRGRTTVGLSGLAIEDAVEFLGDCMGGSPPQGRSMSYSPVQLMRFAADDIKAYWMEAASSARKPPSAQLADWFWDETAAGAQLIALRARALASDNASFKAVGGGLIVPGARVAKMESASVSRSESGGERP